MCQHPRRVIENRQFIRGVVLYTQGWLSHVAFGRTAKYRCGIQVDGTAEAFEVRLDETLSKRVSTGQMDLIPGNRIEITSFTFEENPPRTRYGYIVATEATTYDHPRLVEVNDLTHDDNDSNDDGDDNDDDDDGNTHAATGGVAPASYLIGSRGRIEYGA